MSLETQLSADRQRLTVLFPAALEYDDYRILRDSIIKGNETVNEVTLDFSRLTVMPTWLAGLLLHLEEALQKTDATLKIINCQHDVETTLRFANMDRFLAGGRS
jgi:anti-anti-sigma regulatory factor